MRHHLYKPEYEFVKAPVEFDKYTDKQLLQYCLGATLYMPATKDFSKVILGKGMLGLTSMVMCFEDAIKSQDLSQAEKNAASFLDSIFQAKKEGNLSSNDIPLIFFRVRTPEQFMTISSHLKPEHVKILAGFVFPKFSSANGEQYFEHLKDLNLQFGDVLYGMPILEGQEIAYAETRQDELRAVRKIADRHKDLVLNIRVGGTDFSSVFGVRRGIDYTIYDILTVRDCLQDILNTFSRNNDYVISGPVWEYFLASREMKFDEKLEARIQSSLLKRNTIVNDAIDGLLREVILDKANGFVGKTIIHPSHLNYVNALQAVTKEEYDDAMQILNTSGGVVKSASANKMNEIAPHRSWANKVDMRAKAFGVVEDECGYINLFS